MQKYHTQGSRRLYQATLPYLVDGVGSSFHVPSYRDYPIAMTHGKGSKLYDVDGNEYIDYILGFGPMLLGHCPPAVDRAVAEQLKRGTHFSAPTPELGALSRRLTQVIPAAEKVVYQNSGTEVVMYALRLARAFTGRYKIVKFEGQYHGWSDEEKVSIDADTVADLEALDRTLTQRREEIAAVLMEPCMCDSGPILPQPGYLAGVRELTRRHGVLLICDEVITGFRAEYGGAQTRFGITPDLTTLGKIIGGGLPVGAFGGKREYMSRVAPAGDVYQAGTLSGNPLAMAAGIATLSVLKASDYAALEARVEAFAAELESILRGKGVPVTVNRLASMYTVFFSDGPLRNFEDVKNSDTEMYSRFFRAMRERNIFVAPSAFEVAMVSFAHTEEDFAKTLDAVRGIKL